jgi:hypothetical protein
MPRAKRAAGLLSSLLAQAQASPATTISAASGPNSSSWAARSSKKAATSVTMRNVRGYSSWEGHWTSQSRSQLHSDVVAARTMLPNRSHFIPQFTPHGFQLIPESLLSPLAALQAGAGLAESAIAAAAAGEAGEQQQAQGPQQQQDLSEQQQRGEDDPTAVYADSVKRKRKLKMKKHKASHFWGLEGFGKGWENAKSSSA